MKHFRRFTQSFCSFVISLSLLLTAYPSFAVRYQLITDEGQIEQCHQQFNAMNIPSNQAFIKIWLDDTEDMLGQFISGSSPVTVQSSLPSESSVVFKPLSISVDDCAQRLVDYRFPLKQQ